ncbi:glycosyltransferase family 39 protein [Thauera sinica]|uniref:Glycosyltransferase family 39 protein n=1 Tax=Thauera sinica TaxID=2665146 RepID=A0ABW1AU84_9RHOO|nr:glycosyltransferase family 39 protein [Thauera sp. K11]ATE58582.1 hypothetical protein CCZ27_00130 [Thauera sp. K11]
MSVSAQASAGIAGGGGAAAAATAEPARRRARRLSLLLLAATGVFILLTFDQHGLSNDEEVQHVYGRLLVDFYASGLSDLHAFQYKNLYLYGGLFDLIAALIERSGVVDAAGPDVWNMRHLLSAAFGLAGLAGTWLLARRLAGEWAALAALVVLLVTGAWSGAMFTHTKDIPFATAMVWSLYCIVRVAASLPRPSRGDVVGLGIALGCAFGLRIGAVFAVFYLGVTLLAAAVLREGEGPAARAAAFGRSVVALLPAALIAFALMALFWPWAMMSPGNLWKAMTTFSHFSFLLHTILAGKVMANGDAPGYYLLAYLLVRLPEIFLLGLALAALGGLRALPSLAGPAARRAALPWLPVVLAALFPIGYTLAASPPLYNGIRHFTFLLPPLAVLAGAGLFAAWRRAARWPRGRMAALAGCMLLAAGSVIGLARLHPYEYVAYNGFVGGLRGTAERWEQDYWADSLRDAAEQLNAFVAREGHPERRYTVAVCAESLQAAVWLDPRLTVTKDWRIADFFLSPTHMDCHTALKGEIIGKVEREGVTLAVVRDRRMLAGEERRPR